MFEKKLEAGFHGKTFTLGSKSFGTACFTMIYVSLIPREMEFKLRPFLEDFK